MRQLSAVIVVLFLFSRDAAAATRVCEALEKKDPNTGAITFEPVNCREYSEGELPSAPTIEIDCTGGVCVMPKAPRLFFLGSDDTVGGDARPAYHVLDPGLLAFGPGPGGNIPGKTPDPIHPPKHQPIVVLTKLKFSSCQEFSDYKVPDNAPEEQKEMAKTAFYPKTHLLTVEDTIVGAKPGHPGTRVVKALAVVDWLTATLLVPDPATPPWPNPTPREAQQWRTWATRWYWHELGHASLLDDREGKSVDVTWQGDPNSYDKNELTKVANKAVAAALRLSQDGYDNEKTGTNHGRNQFQWEKIRCDSH